MPVMVARVGGALACGTDGELRCHGLAGQLKECGQCVVHGRYLLDGGTGRCCKRRRALGEALLAARWRRSVARKTWTLQRPGARSLRTGRWSHRGRLRAPSTGGAVRSDAIECCMRAVADVCDRPQYSLATSGWVVGDRNAPADR